MKKQQMILIGHVTSISLIFAAVLTGCDAQPQAESTVTIKTSFQNPQGEVIGSADISSTTDGVVIDYKLTDLTPGVHAMHIHTTGKCQTPDFKSAGGHFAPYNTKHGGPDSSTIIGRHAGDMPNQTATDDGQMSGLIINTAVTLRGSAPNVLLDEDGAALIVHASADDYTSQPSGNAGARVACASLTQAMLTPSSP